MKKMISLILILSLTMALCACGEAGGKDGLQVGFGRESILPDTLGVQIAGGDAFTGHWDKLWENLKFWKQ